MRILIVSDSHGDDDSLAVLAKMYPNMDLYLHLGDSESDEFLISPFISVKGNNDFAYNFREYLVIPTPMGNIYACHYPYISYSELKAHETKFFIFGHTHVRKHVEENGIVKINPGAIRYARDTHKYSYAILDINSDGYSITFKSLVEND